MIEKNVTQTTHLHSPNSIPWPPIIFLSALLLSFLMEYWVPTELADLRPFGWILFGLGVCLDIWAILIMREAQTNILPHYPADKLVTWGPFKFTRNPIYLGNTAILFGLGIAFNSLWFLGGAVLSAVSIHTLAILPEERHLLRKFNQDWINYASKTPRWLIRIE